MFLSHFIFLLWAGLLQHEPEFTRLDDFPGMQRDDAVAVRVGKYFYAGLGYAPAFYPLADWWQYDMERGHWQQLADVPFPARQYVGSSNMNDEIYLLGGYHDHRTFFRDFWRYKPDSQSWEALADLPGPPRWASQLITLDGKLYGGLGQDTNRYFQDWYRYDASLDQWQELAPYPGEGTAKGVGVAFAGKIIVGLGRNDQGSLGGFWSYDTGTDRWEKLSLNFQDSLSYVAYTMVDKYLYFFGGQAPDNQYNNCLYRLNLAENDWQKFCGGAASRRGANLLYSGEQLYLLWGLDAQYARLKDFYRIALKHPPSGFAGFPNPFRDFIHINLPEQSTQLELLI